MRKDKSILLSIFWVVLGAALMIAGYAGRLDVYWSSMGTAVFVIGGLEIIRWRRYRTDGAYKAQVDMEAKDERNRFISGRAWAWAGYMYVFIGAVASIAFKVAGNDTLALAASMSVCLVMVLYWVSWTLLRRKY